MAGEIKVIALWKYQKLAANDAPFVYQCTVDRIVLIILLLLSLFFYIVLYQSIVVITIDYYYFIIIIIITIIIIIIYYSHQELVSAEGTVEKTVCDYCVDVLQAQGILLLLL